MALTSAKGIILKQIKYGDTSLICQIYTEEYGRRAFLFKGIRSKKSKIHPNILQALFIVKLEFYYKEGHEMFLVKDASLETIFNHFPYDIHKSSQAIFIAEVLNKCLREEESNNVLYSFVRNSIEYFDLVYQGSANFHLIFLVKLSKHLGFYPSLKMNSQENFFDLKDGVFRNSFPLHSDYMDDYNSTILHDILDNNYDQLSLLELNQKRRNELLDLILKFYTLHFDGINNLKSYHILKEIFS